MGNPRDFDPIVCVDCGFQSDNEDDFEWVHAEPDVNWPGDAYCDNCYQNRWGRHDD